MTRDALLTEALAMRQEVQRRLSLPRSDDVFLLCLAHEHLTCVLTDLLTELLHEVQTGPRLIDNR